MIRRIKTGLSAETRAETSVQVRNTVEGILPIAKRHNVGAFNWGFVAGKTQTYLPWDSWDHPYKTVPKVWFSDLVNPDGRPYQDSEIQMIRQLAGGSGAT